MFHGILASIPSLSGRRENLLPTLVVCSSVLFVQVDLSISVWESTSEALSSLKSFLRPGTRSGMVALGPIIGTGKYDDFVTAAQLDGQARAHTGT